MLVVITGGVRSGKSAAAERLALQRGGDVVVAAFGNADGDSEMEERIERHRGSRPDGWVTLEPARADGWLADVPVDALLVIDCLGTLAGRIMAEEWPTDEGHFVDADTLPADYAGRVLDRVAEIVAAIVARPGDTLVVTNEVGDGIVPPFATGRLFRDVIGRANRSLVDSADAAWLVVAGRMLDLTSQPRDARWPED